MPLHLSWPEIALRLALSFLAGGLIGLNREEHGRPAGLRTNILVCLAAALAMLQANLWLDTSGKAPDGFVVLDNMRLPLGVLSGMGFIGAGAILRKGPLIHGVTTAATLWYVTLVGFCFGGGLLGLGLAGLGLGLLVLWALKRVEHRIHCPKRATLILTLAGEAPGEDEIRAGLAAAGLRVRTQSAALWEQGHRRTLGWVVEWRAAAGSGGPPPDFVSGLARRPGVQEVRWEPEGDGSPN